MTAKIIRFEPNGPGRQGMATWPEIPASELTAGTPVQRDGREVGEIRSGQGDRAIAMLQLEAASGALVAEGARIIPERPAWMKIPEAS